ncbi:MAG: chromosome segregation protein SMC [Bacillota bacterium]|nr:chromosome segregation protein SMC [Bacillota bacterium]
MILKNITLQGFKSFADKITIELDGSVCAIVGPNGSGKSNISDAIRWVLGEQSVKSLRGSKMEDVIFSGTSTRKPSGFAEVTLTLDNSRELLPVDFSEVAITRRVYRSGESEYFINKAPCRLKDIYELMMDTGLGRDGYSIIGQGKIDQILYANPEDRRSIFEEASGISKYKYRKNEATRKLERTNENLLRVNDIILELQSQLDPLKEQSEKAQKFLTLSKELKGLEVTAFVNSIDKNRAQLEKFQKNHDDIEAEFNEAKAFQDSNEEEIEAYYEAKKLFDNSIEAIKQEANGIQLKASQAQSEILIKKSSIENILGNVKRIEDEIEALSGQNQAESIETAKELVFKAEKIKSNLKAEFDLLDIAPVKEKVDSLSSLVAQKSAAIELLTVKKEGKVSRLESFDIIEEEHGKRLSSIAEDIKAFNLEVEKQKQEISEKEEKKKHLETLRQQFNNKKTELSDKYNKLNETDGILKNRYNKDTGILNENAARLNFLEELEKDMDGYSGAVKSILENKNLRGIKGALSELIKVQDKYVQAIEAALGGSMQNIVTDTDKDSNAAIDYLKSRGKGRATFLPLNIIKERSMEPMKHDGYLGPVSDFVNCESDIRPAVLNLLGNVALCDSFENAINMFRKENGRVRIVTLSGEFINSGGAVTGGSLSKVRGLLSRKKEIESLKKTTSDWEDKVAKIESEIDENDKAIEKIRKEAALLTKSIEENAEAYTEVSSDIEINLRLLENKMQRLFEMEKEKDELKFAFENRDKAKEDLNVSIEESKAELEKERDNLSAITQQLKASRIELENMTQARVDKTIEVNNASKDLEMYFSRLEAAQVGRESRLQLIELKREEIKRLNEDIKRKEQEISLVNMTINNLNSLYEQKGKEIEAKKDEFLKKDENTSKLREENKSLREKTIALAQDLTKLQGKIEALEQEVESDIEKLWEEYELTYSEAAKERDANGSKASSAALISKLKRDIKELGTINVAAIEDYKNVSERYGFLSGQRDDLRDAKGNLEQIIKDMQKIMCTQFSEQFIKITESFRDTYVSLTGGGSANILLTDPTDVLESGIEIEIQPPGKKLQNIMLLSGGEKAIAAIALFFALLAVRPAPFCVLDEIEAALDEGNVARFASFLRNYNDTQFLVITHRRGTMETADALYGVTMQEKGVSKLLSLNLKEASQ